MFVTDPCLHSIIFDFNIFYSVENYGNVIMLK